ncbi:MAG: immunity 26/phosphotriesterase HocA family protein [Spirochaetota bacterium]
MNAIKQRRTIGSVVQISLVEGYFSYARVLQEPFFAFDDIYAKEEITDLDQITSSPILFITSVSTTAITSNRWLKIGKKTLEESLQELPPQFTQNPLNPDEYTILYMDGRYSPYFWVLILHILAVLF